jgi:hypothetical protein
MHRAKPSNIKRPAVVIMMSLSEYIPADFALLPQQPAIADSVAGGIPCGGLERMQAPMAHRAVAVARTASARSPLPIVFPVVFELGDAVGVDVIAGAYLAFVKVPVCHFRMLVKLIQRQKGVALEAYL